MHSLFLTMLKKAVAVVILVGIVILGVMIWNAVQIPAGTGWCEKAQPEDKPAITILNPESLTPETTSVRMAGSLLVVDTVGDFVSEGRKASIQFEMRNSGLGNAIGIEFILTGDTKASYQVKFGGSKIAENSPFDMCAGFSFQVLVQIFDNAPGSMKLIDENSDIVGPAQIQIN